MPKKERGKGKKEWKKKEEGKKEKKKKERRDTRKRKDREVNQHSGRGAIQAQAGAPRKKL